MTKRTSETLISTAICLLPVLLAWAVFDRLPDQVAIHFDAAGDADNYLPRAWAAFGLPVAMAAINLYVRFRLDTDPQRANTSSALKQLSRWLAPALSIIFVPVMLFKAMGTSLSMPLLGGALAGMVIVVSGNYLPKCRRNYTVGIKLPWTLESERNWNKTHRLGGFVWVIGGLLITASAFLSLPYVALGVTALVFVIPIIYSYLLYRGGLRDESVPPQEA